MWEHPEEYGGKQHAIYSSPELIECTAWRTVWPLGIIRTKNCQLGQ